MQQWVVTSKRADFKEIGRRFGIDQVTARIIRNRDVIGEDAIAQYLNGSLKDLADMHQMKDADLLVNILTQKIQNGNRIRIIGDYDIDGVMSSYILYRALLRCGADVDVAIPNRITDGYGLNLHLIEDAMESDVDTIITCDNGIAALEEIAYAIMRSRMRKKADKGDTKKVKRTRSSIRTRRNVRILTRICVERELPGM